MSKLFKLGWRSFAGWVCGVALCCQFVVGPLLTWVAALAGRAVPFPALDLSALVTLLSAMLGLGVLRTK